MNHQILWFLKISVVGEYIVSLRLWNKAIAFALRNYTPFEKQLLLFS